MRRALFFLFLLLLAVSPARSADRPVLPRSIDTEALPFAPGGRSLTGLTAPACNLGNLNPLAWAIGDWFIGSED